MGTFKQKIVMAFACLCWCFHLFAFVENFATTTYNSGLPNGWVLKNPNMVPYVSFDKTQPQTPSGSSKSGMCVNFYNAQVENLLYLPSKIPDSLIADTILVEMELYEQQVGTSKIDAFQVVVSTNDSSFSSYIEVGELIPIRKNGRTNDDWVSCRRSILLKGLSAPGTDLYVGIRLKPAGKSYSLGYIRSLRVDIAASAMPTEVCLKRDDVVTDALLPRDENLSMSVNVLPDPNDDRLKLEGVYGVVDRNGLVSTNRLANVTGSNAYTNLILKEELDAGERVLVSAFSKYTTTLPAAGISNRVDGFIYEDMSSPVPYIVGKAGSVWINELSADRIELCGTTNRAMTASWSLVVKDGVGQTICVADLGEPFNFKTNMINNVVGLDVRDLLWAGALPMDGGTYFVSLVNSKGVVEDPDLVMTFSNGTVKGRTGYAKWCGKSDDDWSYDWTGTATDGTFDWGVLSKASFGKVNEGQGFRIPASVDLVVRTNAGSGDSAQKLSYANVTVSVADLKNEKTLGTTNVYSKISSDGMAKFTGEGAITGYSPFPNEINATISGTAFGWVCKGTNVVWKSTLETNTIDFIATIAEDKFSKQESYWENLDTYLKWTWSGGRLKLDTFNAQVGTGRLKCRNPLSAHGRKIASIAFEYQNTPYDPGSSRCDLFSVLISTNADFIGTIVSTPALSNKRADYGDVSYRYQANCELPESFSTASELWLELHCVSQYRTWTYTYVDNLRISFEDVALPTNLTPTVETPMSGGSTGFVLDVLPQTTDEIEEVSADLHITVNGAKRIVPFAHPDGSLTNRISIADGDGAPSLPCATKMTISPEALEKVCGKFYAGQTVSYYAAVHYNSANGDTDPEGVYETRYFPDNAKIETVETAEGKKDYWIVEGGYKAIEDQYGFTVDGPDIDILGAPVITADGIAFDYHAWDRTGNKGIIGLTATVRKEGEEVSTTALFEGAATNRVTDTCALTGLDANTEYTLTISGKRNSGGDLTSKSITFVTRPVLTATTIVGTSPSTAKLTASGQAAGFVVTPSDWVQESDSVQDDVRTATWTRGEGTPNSQMSATVYATNKVGLASMTTNSPSGFTLAAVATKAPVIQKGTVTVEVGAEEGYVAGTDGNPEGTEYAVRVTTSEGGDKLVTTNGVVVWKSLADWKADPVTVEKPTIDLLATNFFSFITRNFDKTVSPNGAPVTTNCWFDMTAEVAGAEQTADFGKVDVALQFSDPAQSEGAVAAVEYQIVGKGDWTVLDSFDVPFDEVEMTTNITWDAWAAVGEVEGNYEYLLRAKVTDEAHDRSSGWVEMAEAGELDFVKPTVTLSSETPSPFNTAPLVVTVTFSEDVTGFDENSLSVGNGTAVVTGSGDTYTVSVTPEYDGAVTVKVLADKVVDQFGNKNKVSDVLSRTYDTKPPVIQPIEGEPSEMVVTNGTGFAFTVSATDESTSLKYHWTTNEVAVAGNTTSELTGEDAIEGTNVVTVCAEDAAGNVSESVKRTWVVDTIVPTEPVISGKPAEFTNVPAFSMTASSEDATRLTYHWTFNDADFTGATLAKTAQEGQNDVRVYATDEAGNVSTTNRYSWTLDTHKPTNLKIDGEPQEGVVTNGTEFTFTASASDATALTFLWTTNGVAVADYTAAGLSGTAIEGTNTVSVSAKDAAGNVCEPTNRTWVVDTIAPTLPEISGKPAALTNETAFSMTASSEDATRLTFHWTFNDADFTGATLAKTAREGANAVRVYATDEAGNVSPTNFWNWVVDTQPPTEPVITGIPEKGSITNVKAYDLTAASTDAHLITYHWTLGERTAAVTNFVGSAEDGDGTYTASVYATDAAGNVSGTTTWTWTLDTTAPTDPVISGTPANGSVTNEPNFSLMGAATDNLTTITYHWLTNGVAAADVTNLVGTVEEEGLFAVKCYATDAAGNVSKTNDWSWTLDKTPPTKPVITDNLKKSAITNVKAYDLTAASTDDHLIAYHWTLGETKETVTNFVGSVTSSGEYTDFTAYVYAKDVAGNVSETSSISWRLDTKHPTVTLASTTSGHFNRKAAPMVVTATFSEEVTNFTYKCVTVQTGTVSNEIEVVQEKKVFKFWVYPEHYGVPTFIDEETVSVSIDANKVWDYAGNGNEASRNEQGQQAPLTRIYDTKSPIVNLTSETPDAFNAEHSPLKVTIDVTGKEVTELRQESIIVTNGTITLFNETETRTGEGGVITERIYALEVTPTKEALITVVVPESVLTNMTGNTNPASEPPVLKTYDNTAPKNLAINGEPAQNKVTAATTFDFEATAEDLTAMTFHWTLNGVAVTDNETFECSGTVGKGTNTVTVSATDAAGNICAEVKRTWVVDFEPPENLTLSGTPGKMDEIVVTNGTDFAYKTSATDDTRITYHWMTNGVEVADNASAELVGTAVEGTNTVAVYATDEADNVSVTNTIVWVVDTIDPTVPVLEGTPTDKSITQQTGYSYTAESEDATILTYIWKLDGGDETEKNAGAAFEGTGLADGVHKVAVYAKDESGNKSVATNWTWTVDTTKPTNMKVWGLPISDEKIVVTNGFDFAFEASATDATALKFHWATNGVAVTDCTTSNFVGKVGEGTNTVSVYAEDAAGNVCEAVERKWVVDTIDPTVPVISGTPADKAITQQTGYSYTAESEDATILTYIWKLDGGDETEKNAGAAFEGTGLADGVHKVAVYAKDESGNKSVATNWTWTVDTTKPTNMKVWGLPISDEKIVVTNGFDFAFEASATDATALKFHWVTNGVAVMDCTTSNFVGKVGEGTNTVSVYAEDAAGNVCEPVARTWVVDTIAPTVPVISGAPADKSVTQAKGYSYTAESEDATILTYIWKLDGGEETEKDAGVAFAGSGLADGTHKVTVYAKDEAGNKSVATNWTWTVDTTKPTDMKVWGLPISDEKIVVTNGFDFAFEASATDATALKFHWATNGVAVTDCTTSNFVGRVGEGTNTVSVYAEDAAGNVCEPVERTWVVDTIAPTVPVISGEPADKAVTQETGYSYTAESEDATILTYIWKLDGGEETEKNAGEAFAGSGLADGVYKVTVYAKDEAGNKSVATNWTWTVDTTKPTNLKVWGLPISENPEVLVLTNGCDFAFEASATDATALKFHWATNGVTAAGCTASNFVGRVSEGTNTVSVYAKDAAGNFCDPIERKWVVDLTPPTVTLSTETPENHVINRTDVFKVTVAFSEDVKGFTQGSVSVGNGAVTAVTTNSAASYTVTVSPAQDGQVSVRVEADAVTDLAGNGNVASVPLTRTCDVTPPTVTLRSEMYEAFGLSDLWWDFDFDGTMPVTVTFSEPVTGFTASSASVGNGTVTEVVTNDAASYVVKIEPNGDGQVSVQIAQGAVTDLAGNGNVASRNEQGSQAPLTRECDVTPPTKPVVSGTPAKGSSTFDGSFNLTAVSEDDSGIYDYVWNVFVNGAWQEDVSGDNLTGTMTQPGEYLVEVYAEDVFFNQSRSTYWYWVLDAVTGASARDVSFSSSVRVPVSKDEQPSRVTFESMDIRPDGVSTFVLSGFKAENQDINGLRMRLVVSDTLGGEPRYVEVGENASYEDGLLTIKVPEGALQKDGESKSSVFIIGVDNRVFDESLED